MVICDLGREYSAAADVTFVYIYLYCICSIGLLRPCDVLLWRLFLFLRNYPYDLISKFACGLRLRLRWAAGRLRACAFELLSGHEVVAERVGEEFAQKFCVWNFCGSCIVAPLRQ